MSVFKSLSEEHALLLNLVGRLDRATAEPDSRAAARTTRDLLLVLLKALEAHEGLERLVFDEMSEPEPGPKSAALALIERQHHALAALRDEAAVLFRRLGSADDTSVWALTRRLTRLLRRHFADEERILWPHFHAAAGRSRLHALDRLAREQVRAMERELDGYLLAVED